MQIMVVLAQWLKMIMSSSWPIQPSQHDHHHNHGVETIVSLIVHVHGWKVIMMTESWGWWIVFTYNKAPGDKRKSHHWKNPVKKFLQADPPRWRLKKHKIWLMNELIERIKHLRQKWPNTDNEMVSHDTKYADGTLWNTILVLKTSSCFRGLTFCKKGYRYSGWHFGSRRKQ